MARSKVVYEQDMKRIAADFSARISQINQQLAQRREEIRDASSSSQIRNERLVLGFSFAGVICGVAAGFFVCLAGIGMVAVAAIKATFAR